MESRDNERPSAERRSTAIAYRPRSFNELVGQEFVAHAITNALEQQSVAHAYLLCGPRGVGKTTTARLLAQYLNHGGESTDQQWEAIRNGSGLDVIEIDGASNTSVQDVRQIKENILYPPQASPYKIYIIDEVHMLSTSAFNALLKTIEEPPPYVVFIFATTEAEKLPMTVRSRCQQFHFRLIPTDVIAKQLTEVAAQLNIAINQEVVYWIAREAQGSMRDAYTLFDQLSVLGDDLLDLDTLRKHFGFAETKQLAELIVLLSQQQIAKAMQLFDAILNAGVSIESICNDMTQLYRALLMYSYGIEVSHTEMIPPELTASLATYSDVELLAIIEELVNVFRSLKDSLNPRFSCELVLARIGYIKDRVTPRDIHNALENISGETGVTSKSNAFASGAVAASNAAGATGKMSGMGAFGSAGASGASGVSGVANTSDAPNIADTVASAEASSATGGVATSTDAIAGTPRANADASALQDDGVVGNSASTRQSTATATLDPLMPHTSASLRSELTKEIGGELGSGVHSTSASVELTATPDEGRAVATPPAIDTPSDSENGERLTTQSPAPSPVESPDAEQAAQSEHPSASSIAAPATTNSVAPTDAITDSTFPTDTVTNSTSPTDTTTNTAHDADNRSSISNASAPTNIPQSASVVSTNTPSHDGAMPPNVSTSASAPHSSTISPSIARTTSSVHENPPAAASTNATNQPINSNERHAEIRSPHATFHPASNPAHTEHPTEPPTPPTPTHPHQASQELSIDEISQVVHKAIIDKPIIHNLLIHDCTWSVRNQAVTIAVPTEFDKTTLTPYHHALTEAVSTQWGETYTITLTLAAKDSNTDKLISMTKKMFNAVE